MTDTSEAPERASNEVPPSYDLAAEQELLGFLLNKPDAVTEVIEIVQARDFFDPINRRIYECVVTAFDRGDEVSVATIMGSPDAKIAGDLTISQYIAKLMAAASPSTRADELADHIQQLSEQRIIAADNYERMRSFQSSFGGQCWEDIGQADNGRDSIYDWLVEDIIPLGEISLIFGDSGSGKSFSTFDMLVKVARGQCFSGRNVTPGLVVYVAAEAGKGFSKRKVAYSMHHNIQPDAPIPFYLCTKRPDFFTSDDDVDRLIREIEFVASRYKAKLVCIALDTLSALAPGMNENASQDVSMVRKRLNKLQEAFKDTSIILVHHKPKNGSTPRGHGSLTADFETTIEYEKTGQKDSRKRTIYRGTVRKQREGKSGISWSFTLPTYEVGRNKWGNVETSCVAVPYDSPVVSNTGYKPNGEQKTFLEALWKALADDPASPPAQLNLPRSITAVVEQRLIRENVAAAMIQADDDPDKHKQRVRTLISRAGKALRAAGIIGTADQPTAIVWYTGRPVMGMTQRIEEASSDGA